MLYGSQRINTSTSPPFRNFHLAARHSYSNAQENDHRIFGNAELILSEFLYKMLCEGLAAGLLVKEGANSKGLWVLFSMFLRALDAWICVW